MENVLDLNNWIVVGQARLKIREWGWPIVVLAIGYWAWEHVTTSRVRRVK